MNELPRDLQRAIADRCSLASLLNLQLVSKDLAGACRGLGAKFRGIPVEDLCADEEAEVEEYVDENARLEFKYGCIFFFIRYTTFSKDRYVGNDKNHLTDREKVAKYVEYEWGSKRHELVAEVMAANVLSIVRPTRFMPKRLFVPDDLGVSLRPCSYELETVARRGGFASTNTDAWRSESWIVRLELSSAKTGKTVEFEDSFDMGASAADIEKGLWRRKNSRQFGAVFKRPTRANPPKPPPDLESLIRSVDFERIVRTRAGAHPGVDPCEAVGMEVAV